jgi:hypothetical protein
MPLAALALYFTLRTVREMPLRTPADTAAAAQGNVTN